MRIRKNAKLSPLLFSSNVSSPEVLQSHVCRLNQSPWDVIPFHRRSLQNETVNDSFTVNGSLGDSIGAVESVSSLMDGSAKLEEIVYMNDNQIMMNNNGAKILHDNGENGRKFNKGKKNLTLCDSTSEELKEEDHYHDYVAGNNTSSKKSTMATEASTSGSRRGARVTRAGKKVAAGTNPYEFYYYSGFGPLWGKRRGDREGSKNNLEGKIIENNVNVNVESITSSSTRSISEMDGDEFDYVADELDDDDNDNDNNIIGDGNGDTAGKKRMRKPVKARSLKSLM